MSSNGSKDLENPMIIAINTHKTLNHSHKAMSKSTLDSLNLLGIYHNLLSETTYPKKAIEDI